MKSKLFPQKCAACASACLAAYQADRLERAERDDERVRVLPKVNALGPVRGKHAWGGHAWKVESKELVFARKGNTLKTYSIECPSSCASGPLSELSWQALLKLIKERPLQESSISLSHARWSEQRVAMPCEGVRRVTPPAVGSLKEL